MYKRILVIKLRHIGDVLLTTPVFKALKENFPEAFVSALVNKSTEAVLEKNPHIDQIITYDRGIKKLQFLDRYAEEMRFLNFIRKMKFDTTIDLTGGDRAAVISYFSRAKRRIGISAQGFLGKKHFYTDIFEIDGKKHTLLQNLEVLEKMGIKIIKPEVILHVTEDEKKWAKNLIQPSTQYKVVHIHPTSRWLFKCWRDEYMAEVIKWLIDKGCKVVLTASAEEKELKKIDTIISYLTAFSEANRRSTQLVNLAGKLTLRQLIAVSSVCDLYFGIDTAPMHIAAALGKPVVALFGPSGAFNWGPWDNEANESPYYKRNGIQRYGKNIVIQRDWSCIPCGKDGCEGSKISNCLVDIKPKEVIDIISEEIKRIRE